MYTVHRRENRIKALEDEKNVKNGINGDKKDITKLETEDEQIKQDTFKQMSINETLDSEIPLQIINRILFIDKKAFVLRIKFSNKIIYLFFLCAL